jgi:probable HAF family extracellular repeat protein
MPDCVISNLGTLPSPFDTVSIANGCSADGSVVVGGSGPISADRAFRWTEVGGMVDLGVVGNPTTGDPQSEARDCSADGNIIVGYTTISGTNRLRAFRWVGGIMTNLGVAGISIQSDAYACSSDGSVVVGASGKAFRWTQAGGMVEITTDSIGRANDCSGDGSVVVGLTGDGMTNSAFRWTQAGGLVILPTLGGNSVAQGCSADGSIIVGYSTDTNIKAVRWVNGGIFTLPLLPGGTFAQAQKCSADGSVIVGYGDITNGIRRAFKWTQADGTVDIGALTGQTSAAFGCSANGSVIVGQSDFPNGIAFRYVCPLPPTPPEPTPSGNSSILPTPITFITPPVNPQTGDYDSSRLTNEKADKVIRVYTDFNRSNAMPVFPDYATYMRYRNGALRF